MGSGASRRSAARQKQGGTSAFEAPSSPGSDATPPDDAASPDSATVETGFGTAGCAASATASGHVADVAAVGADGSGGPAAAPPVAVLVPPSLQRRRRLLFGPEAAEAQSEFEAIDPQKQFDADYPEDMVLQRFGDGDKALENLNEIRRLAAEQQFYINRGLLEKNALELLKMDIDQKSDLAQLLFQTAQAQVLPSRGKRGSGMTCYEFLGLYGLLHGAQDEELLEFLFCMFDSDQDDVLSEADLTVAIRAFLQLKDTDVAFKDNKEDRVAFLKLGAKELNNEARSMAKLAIKNYGMGLEEEKQAPEEGEVEATGADRGEASAKGDGTLGGGGASASSKKKKSKRGDDASSDSSDSDKSKSSMTPGTAREPAGAATAVRRPRRGLCAGKPPQEPEDADDSAAEDASRTSKSDGDATPPLPTAPKPKPRPRRGVLCRGAPAGAEGEKSEGEDAPFILPKAKPKAAPKRRTLCGAGGKKKGPTGLDFRQWKRWIVASELVPAGFAGLPPPPPPTSTFSGLEEGLAAAPSSSRPAAVPGAGVGPTDSSDDSEEEQPRGAAAQRAFAGGSASASSSRKQHSQPLLA